MQDGMQGVVLAAGKGTRLQPLTNDKPKGMVRVDGRPLLDHVFEDLVSVGVDELVVVVGYKKEAIIQHFGQKYRNVPIKYVHQVKQNGLADALCCASHEINGKFVLMLGDLIFEDDLSNIVNCKNTDSAIIVDEVDREEASRYGVCKFDENGRLESLVEKPDNPPSNKIISGVYILPEEILGFCSNVSQSDRGEYELTDAINNYLCEGNEIEAIDVNSRRIDVGYPSDRKSAEELVRKREQESIQFVDR